MDGGTPSAAGGMVPELERRPSAEMEPPVLGEV